MGLVNHYMSCSVWVIDFLIESYSKRAGERYALVVEDLVEAKRRKLALA